MVAVKAWHQHRVQPCGDEADRHADALQALGAEDRSHGYRGSDRGDSRVKARVWLIGSASLVLGLVAVFVGAPLTAWVLRRLDRAGGAGQGVRGVLAAAAILKGGRTIGMLERAAVYGCVACGWPEGIAVVVALKGLGRFAELRGPTEGTAERFLIGSFTSLLLAGALGAAAHALIEFT